MSGGHLVVLDRLGRDVKCFPLSEGVVTLGSDHSCDIRFMLDTVDPHHATVAVHANQTVVRNICGGSTLVNGRPVSVAALRHGDVVSIGGRELRWDYARPEVRRGQAPQPALYVSRRAGRAARAARRTSGPAPAGRRDPAVQVALEMAHRASMPANAGGKQVAIVQPQRRDTNEQVDTSGPAPTKRAVEAEAARKGSPRATLGGATMATLWIESRKGRRSAPRPPRTPRTPLRTVVLRKAHSARKAPVTKIQAPLNIDHTKQAAILLMTGHTPKSKFLGQKTPSPNLTISHSGIAASDSRKSVGAKTTTSKSATPKATPKSETSKVTTPSPATSKATTPKSTRSKAATPRSARSKASTPKSAKSKAATPKSARSKATSPKSVSPKATTSKSVSPKPGARRSASFVVKKKSPVRRSARGAAPDRTAAAGDATVANSTSSTRRHSSRRASQRSFEKSPLLPSPKKSALKNPLAKKSMRKTESIKFDLSNLENHSQESDILMVTDSTRRSGADSASEGDLTLHYSETSSAHSPSPRRSIHSRSGRILERTLGTTITISPPSKTFTPVSPRSRKSLRGSVILQKALSKSDDSSSRSRRALSPRSPKNDLESYSIVDLVSMDSNASGRSTSLYNSATSAPGSGSTRGSLGGISSRKTKSTFDSTLLGSSTPYATVTRSSSGRLQSSPGASPKLSNDITRLTGDSSGLMDDSSRMSSRSRLTNNRSRLLNGDPRVSATRSRLSSNRSRLSSDSSKLSRDRTRFSSGSSKSSNNGTRLSSSSSKLLNDETRYGSILSSKSLSRKTKSLSTPENASIPISLNSTRMSRVSRSRSRINDSDVFLIEPEESGDSPRSSKRTSSGSKRSVSVSQRNSTAVNTTPASQQEQGISTPENTQSPEEASTPVLNIQSLLDSSHSSLPPKSSRKDRSSLKRKTFAILSGPKTRVSTKSKSLNFTSRKSQLRLSNDSYENMNIDEQQDGEVVTPKSAVKLVQEAVKNKHSTAKKPQSKRSIIDDLNESDIVKQLFNSPVKRKLSQSMTEFSRKQLFDEEDIAQARRPTRNTLVLGMVARSPDDSLLDRTEEAFTPDQFVSPISTPGNSPNLAGIKRLFGKKTPENDLRNIKGIKALLRTPRARKSIKNDLSDVAGVKAVFAVSPRNRLSDVRVKEVFAASPNNDLRRVSGVKSLFQSQKKRKSPRNSLGDVRGVKKLFNRKSPTNDLRNVSGVKRALQRSSPKNDLSDVRGVKRLFRRDKLRNELSDLSGVEELFNESNSSHRDAEGLFDQLVGRPTIKAVYSRSFGSQPKSAKKNSPKSKSLREITLNPEEWLEQKLKTLLENRRQRLQKDTSATLGSKSANRSKLNVTRELQKLATATVQGAAPLRESARREPAPRASQVYSARKLPIKKRSFADASLETAENDSKLLNLPIKKRAVLHSTPVKGRQLNMTMNASELGRVSPIATEKTRDLENEVPRTAIDKDTTEMRPKSRRTTKGKLPAKALEVTKPSPKKTREKSRTITPIKSLSAIPAKDKSPGKLKTQSPAKNIPSPSPVSPKPTRSRRTAPVSPKAVTAKNRKPRFVVAKKSPVMSPQRRESQKRKNLDTPPAAKVVSPKRTRSNRNKDEKVAEKPKTPMNTRAKVLKVTVVVSKPSPQLKPRATRAKADQGEAIATKRAPQPGPPQDTRRAAVKSKKTEPPKRSPARRSPKVVIERLPKTKGSRKTTVSNATSKQDSVEVDKAQLQTRRGRAAGADKSVEAIPRKTRKTNKHESIREEPPTKINKKQEKPAAAAKATRGKKLVQQESVRAEPVSRPRRGAKADASAPEVSTRKRKTAAVDDRPAKLSKNVENEQRAGRRKKVDSPRSKSVDAAQKSLPRASKEPRKQAAADVSKKTTRSKKVQVPVEQPAQRSTRAKKNATAEVAPPVGQRKRKTATESPPVEEARKKSRAGKKADVTSPPQGGRARPRRRR